MSIKADDIVPLNHVRGLLEEAVRGLEDVRDGRVESARELLVRYLVKHRECVARSDAPRR